MNTNPVVLEDWFTSRLADPVSKAPLHPVGAGVWRATDGPPYRCIGGILDLRALAFRTDGVVDTLWRLGQAEYEAFSRRSRESEDVHRHSLDGPRRVYEQIEIRGSCLDVGGHQGRLRYFLRPDVQYAIVEPMIDVFASLRDDPGALAAYPQLREPVNFVCGLAELLPIRSSTFDVVHMRSVLDHFFCAELALREAWRVLRQGGQLIIGTYAAGGRSGKLSARERLRDLVNPILVKLLPGRADFHVWHPTFSGLAELMNTTGFEIEQTIWQPGTGDRVVYIVATKREVEEL